MIRSIAAAGALALLVSAGAAQSVSAKAAGKAYYTAAQAATGHKQYEANCSQCHGADLSGVSAPPLRGTGFTGTQSVSDIYTYMATNMPAGRSGELKPAVYAAIMAYVLQQNGHPAGSTALTPAIAKSIKAML